MKIRSQKREGNRVSLEIEEDYREFEKAVDGALVQAGKEVNIPGFRPGKAPKELVERSINRDVVESRAAQSLISNLYSAIINESKLEPVDFPNVEIVQQEKDKPFVFKLSVDVYPEVKLGKYKGLKVDRKKVDVTDDEVIKVLGNIQDRMVKPGPDGKKEILPLDDEFAGKVSRFGTLAELKEEIREAMLKDRKQETESNLKNQLIAAASGEAKADVPPGMVEREINVMLDELRASLSQSNLTLDDYLKGIKKEEKAMREELRKPAEMRVKGKVVLDAIAQEEKMAVADNELDAEIKNIADASEKSPEEVKKGLDESARKYLKDYILRRKALELLIEKARITEV